MTRDNFIQLLLDAGWHKNEPPKEDYIMLHNKGCNNPIFVYEDYFTTGIGVYDNFKLTMNNLNEFFHAAKLDERMEKYIN